MALLSPLSGFLFSRFFPAAGAAGEAGLGAAPRPRITGAEGVDLRSPLPPQACVMAPVSSAVASTSVVLATFDGVLFQQGMCPEVLPRQSTSGWVPEGAAPALEVGVGPNPTAVTQVVGTSFPLFLEFEGTCSQAPPQLGNSGGGLVSSAPTQAVRVSRNSATAESHADSLGHPLSIKFTGLGSQVLPRL